ncbi:MAF protein [Calderihabitans maritimus]|uniref:dTTP/UTP pyrophosphatase n=1 Tax=Calderihabitans maritimus TaxID=1246530 RepID=A0A1Z5HVE4_9FIRM|nr:MAF protein [Calderihabitans maritimus]
MQIVLASASPRRQELLKQIGLDFRVMPSHVTEDKELLGTPSELACQLAMAKALSVGEQLRDSLVLGADTLVVHRGTVLGKPRTKEEAARMLLQLQGDMHEVITGVALIHLESRKKSIFHVTTRVFFKPLTEREIWAYVASGEPMDKAGGYGIQGLGAALVEKIEGCYFNVVGLPLGRLVEEFKKFGVYVLK